MTNFVREDVDALNMVLTCTVASADYAPKVKDLLKKLQRTAAIKGFRPGKVPQAMIDRMYEKGAIHDTVVEILDKDLNEYLGNIKYLGQPLPVEDNFKPVNLKAATDFSFKYELGLYPEFTIKGADTSFTGVRYDIEVTDEMLDMEVDTLRKRYGQRGDVDVVGDESSLTVRLTELDEAGAPKEGGLSKDDVKLFVKQMKDEMKATFMGKAVTDSFKINVFEIEAVEQERTKSWILGVDKDTEVNADFECTILEIKDMTAATLDDAFYEKVFGEERDVNDEAGLRNRFEEMIKGEYAGVSTQMLINQVYDNLLTVNQFELPSAFLQKWIVFNDKKLTAEKVAQDWDNIAKDFRWSIMKNELALEADVKITYQDLEQSFYAEVGRYFGNYGNTDLIRSTVQRVMQNEQSVERRFQEMLSERVLLYVASKINVTTEVVNKERFDAILEENNKKHQAEEVAEEA